MKIRLPKSRRYRALIYVVSAILILLAIDLAWVRIWRQITISPETTFITTPLKPDGTPDYLQYMDDKSREDVTNDNNAFIPFLAVLTPSIKPNAIASYYQRLGIPVPTEERHLLTYGNFLGSLSPAIELTKDIEAEESFARTHPWSAMDHPHIAEWLAANEPAFRAIPAIVARPRWYVPLIADHNKLLLSVLLPYLSETRAMGTGLITRAMGNVYNRDFDHAAKDILASHRLARLQARGWFFIDYLVALAIDRSAMEADIQFCAAPGLSPAQRAQFLTDLQGLPPWPAPSLNGERLAQLDALVFAARHPERAAMLLTEGDAKSDIFDYFSFALRPAKFNASLKSVNEFFDHYSHALETPGVVDRERLTASADADIEAMRTTSNHFLGDPSRKILAAMLPSLHAFVTAHDKHEVAITLNRVALALIAYRAENPDYPESIESLVPKFLPTIPPDPYGYKPFVYRKTSEGFILYSVGPNLTDDRGIGSSSISATKDDIVIQVPPLVPAK